MPAAASSLTGQLSNLPPPTADFTETWAFLSVGLDHILSNANLPFSDFTNLYTAVYNYCNSAPELIGVGVKRRITRGANHCVGSDLYHKLKEYFTIHCAQMKQAVASLHDEELLRYYAVEWTRYASGVNYIDRAFMVLNRFWVTQQRCDGNYAIYPVCMLALTQWKSQLFVYIQNDDSKLTGAILRMIERQRNGDVPIDQDLLKNVILSFVSLGFDEKHPKKECLDVYEEHFESPFIEATELYYRKESEAFLAEHTVSEYPHKAEEWLKNEDCIAGLLHASTRNEFIAKCEDVLIRQQVQLMHGIAQTLLDDDDQDDDLQRVCALLSRIPDGLAPLTTRFEAEVTQAGLSAVSKIAGEGVAIESFDVGLYVDGLLGVHDTNSETMHRRYNSHAVFRASLDKACGEFVNRNAATGASPTKSAELIAKHADKLLRKKNKMAEEEDLEGALDRLIIVFKYLEDKDVFQIFYSSRLSKRLIHGVSVSDEAEARMISKLEEACGSEYTNKLQRMLTDVRLSKDLTDAFKQSMEQNHHDLTIDFNVMVLGTNFWPLNPPSHGFVIPIEIVGTYERFQKYYQSKHSGRKLIWLWNYSKNELQTNYLNQKYILMTSAYQMSVLVQYNRHDTLSMDELVAATSISPDILSQVLALLVKAKILVNDEKDQYDLNPGFKSKKIRVNLNQPIKAEVKAESSDVLQAVETDRKYVIQATIVRIMKTRKTMKTQALIQEVISHISQRFAPKVSDIKKAIETLLEKEYLERVDGQKDTLSYVA